MIHFRFNHAVLFVPGVSCSVFFPPSCLGLFRLFVSFGATFSAGFGEHSPSPRSGHTAVCYLGVLFFEVTQLVDNM